MDYTKMSFIEYLRKKGVDEKTIKNILVLAAYDPECLDQPYYDWYYEWFNECFLKKPKDENKKPFHMFPCK